MSDRDGMGLAVNLLREWGYDEAAQELQDFVADMDYDDEEEDFLDEEPLNSDNFDDEDEDDDHGTFEVDL